MGSGREAWRRVEKRLERSAAEGYVRTHKAGVGERLQMLKG